MKKKVLQKIFPALGTVNTVAIYSEYNPAILEQVMQRVLDLHQLFSIFDPQSEISRINENAGICSVPISEDTFSVLSLAIACAGETDGTFDITTGTLSRLWRDAINSKRIPSDAEIEQHHLLGSIADLELDAKNRTAFLRQAGIQLDLGGIAKGYAADEVQRILKENHIENALINLGGTVITIGKARHIGIQNPFQNTGEFVADVLLQNCAAVTSGAYERCFFSGGERYHHIIDPRSGKPSRSGLASVTLIGERAAELDALATGVFILGVKDSLPILHKHGIEAFFISDTGIVQITTGLQTRFTMCA